MVFKASLPFYRIATESTSKVIHTWQFIGSSKKIFSPLRNHNPCYSRPKPLTLSGLKVLLRTPLACSPLLEVSPYRGTVAWIMETATMRCG